MKQAANMLEDVNKTAELLVSLESRCLELGSGEKQDLDCIWKHHKQSFEDVRKEYDKLFLDFLTQTSQAHYQIYLE